MPQGSEAAQLMPGIRDKNTGPSFFFFNLCLEFAMPKVVAYQHNVRVVEISVVALRCWACYLQMLEKKKGGCLSAQDSNHNNFPLRV